MGPQTPMPDLEALAVLENEGMARAGRAQDAALKEAPIVVLCSAPVSPGKAVLAFGGALAAVEASVDKAVAVLGSSLVDNLLLPGVHSDVAAALHGKHEPVTPDTQSAAAILELETVAATLASADAALKSADVGLSRLHLATGFGGKGYFTIVGAQHDVEAAAERVYHVAGGRLLDSELIAAPHPDWQASLFRRPWPLDPALGENE